MSLKHYTLIIPLLTLTACSGLFDRNPDHDNKPPSVDEPAMTATETQTDSMPDTTLDAGQMDSISISELLAATPQAALPETLPEPAIVPSPAAVEPVTPDKAASQTAVKPAQTALKIELRLTDSQGRQYSPKGALISLKSLQQTPPTPAKTTKRHVIDTNDKTYLPGYLVVGVGDTLVFKNNDPIQHNVFSSSGKNAFDLGTYGFGRERSHQVTHEGVIKVYCNIHPEMSLFILADTTSYKAISDERGIARFADLPEGRYLISIWHLRGSIEKKIDIHAGVTQTEKFSIDTSGYQPKAHMNKHGELYKKQPPIFKDEFY